MGLLLEGIAEDIFQEEAVIGEVLELLKSPSFCLRHERMSQARLLNTADRLETGYTCHGHLTYYHSCFQTSLCHLNTLPRLLELFLIALSVSIFAHENPYTAAISYKFKPNNVTLLLFTLHLIPIPPTSGKSLQSTSEGNLLSPSLFSLHFSLHSPPLALFVQQHWPPCSPERSKAEC